MAIITQFTTDPVLISISERHHAWHTPGGAHGLPSRTFPALSPNSGKEFLQFHHDLMNEFFAWNNVHHGAAAAAITPWLSVPSFLKGAETGWPTPFPNSFGVPLDVAENRINSNSPAFSSDDELGIYIEDTVHNWIHGAVAASLTLHLPPVEADIIAHLHSVQCTYFYQIHGLVQHWWTKWLHPKNMVKDVVDTGPVSIKAIRDDHKTHIKDLIDIHTKNQIKDITDTMRPGKQFADVPDPFPHPEEVESIQNLTARLAVLEAHVGIKKSHFIQPLNRPAVADAVTKTAK